MMRKNTEQIIWEQEHRPLTSAEREVDAWLAEALDAAERLSGPGQWAEAAAAAQL